MKRDTYICGIFYAEKQGEESEYLNMKGASSSIAFQETYWKSLIVFFSTAYRTNPKAKLLLFSNAKPPYTKWEELLLNIGVSIIDIPYAHKPKSGHWKAWQSTFYIIDCLGYIEKKVNSNDYIYFMDIDCILLKPLEQLNSILERDGFINYAINYPISHKVHGVSRKDMKKSFSQFTREIVDYPIYFGGEIYGFYGNLNIRKAYDEASAAWKQSLVNPNLTFNTEEHLFTFVFWKLDKQYNNGESHMKRIWTDASTFRNVRNSDLDLTIWHLPSEKRRGLLKIFNKIIDENSSFWTMDINFYKNYLGKYVSIPHRKFNRVFIEYTKICIKKVISFTK
ncbi:hypothetical protein P8864_11015 [Priestia flexa]|uniref:hypothetical protein n=1 Tax=Priestia flexa TaxID=86664 RepID=UPI000C250C56|nr:hypothetical protein [Priestia flexa]MEC0666416.1 hypothetical protein [Priestia flexa]WHX80018.1 hypothetical protein QNH32_05265 [Priestia flexa]